MMLPNLKNGSVLIEVFNSKVKAYELNHVEKTLLVNVVDSLFVKHDLIDFTNLGETGYYHLVDSVEELFDEIFNNGSEDEIDEAFCEGLMDVANDLERMDLDFIIEMRTRISNKQYDMIRG